VAKKPNPAELLDQLYKDMPKEELERQGRELLVNKADERARRAARIGRVAMWTAILAAIVLIGGFSLWLLFKAKETGKSFGEMRREAAKAYVDSDE
jgi:hypothetical protein